MSEPVAMEQGIPGGEAEVLAAPAPAPAMAAGSGPTATAVAASKGEAALGDGARAARQEEPSVSWQDIKSTQNLIERCLQKFMTQTEIIAALQVSLSLVRSVSLTFFLQQVIRPSAAGTIDTAVVGCLVHTCTAAV